MKAEQKYFSAVDDFHSNRFDSCISNLYYSAFQTVCSYLIIMNEMGNKHKYVRTIVNRLAKEKIITKDSAKIYNQLMELRSEADYRYDIIFNEEITKRFLIGVQSFNAEV